MDFDYKSATDGFVDVSDRLIPKQVMFIYYRLLEGLQEFGRLRPYCDNLLPKPLENE